MSSICRRRHDTLSAICPISNSTCPGVCVYAEILAEIEVGVVVLDIIEEVVIFQNPAAEELIGAGTAPKDYRSIREILADSDEVEGRQGETRSVQFGTRVIGYTIYRFFSRYHWIFLRDITEKARLESIAEAVNSMENIGYVFAGIRHEIGNPVNSIKLGLRVLRNNLDSFPREVIADYLDRFLVEISRMEYLLQSLKSFSLYDKIELQPVELGAFVKKLLSMVEQESDGDDVRISNLIPEDPLRVMADPRALHQVMLNVLKNAKDAVRAGSKSEIVIRASKTNGVVWLIVSDNGCGISTAQQKNLFKPFCTTKPGGTGLGLVITKKLLTRMNGSIRIRSQEECGTEVTISLTGASFAPQ